MANKRINVLVYSGNGATVESVRHCVYSLRRLLSPNYAVLPVTGDALIKEPWTSTCALLVMPGGADLPYCRTLNGAGNRRISQFVNLGGAYLGFCAGGYYGSSRCEFMEGDTKMEVIGSRELGFYPGTCRGLAFPGFVYQSEAGACAAEMKVNKSTLQAAGDSLTDTLRVYCNGGGVFVDANKFKSRGVEVLAEYTETLHVDPGDGAAAVVYRGIGDGGVILTGPHPEFAAINLGKEGNGPEFKKMAESLEEHESARIAFLKACLVKLGLQVSQTEQSVPSLSRMHLSAQTSSDVATLMASLQEEIVQEGGSTLIKGANDTFCFSRALDEAVADLSLGTEQTDAEPSSEGIIDFDKVLKHVVIHEESPPSAKETPFFNHQAFYSNLKHYQSSTKDCHSRFGSHLLYGEVVTSTSTLLEKNPSLLHHLPTGLTATATTQLAGRGRGSNIWISPPGSLMFSTVINHPMTLSQTSPVIFLQYLAALAIVEGIQTYDSKVYAAIPIKLKWPNDIYALDTRVGNGVGGEGYVKIGGILVNSSYAGGDYNVVVGVGLNVANAAPTTSLNELAKQKGLEAFGAEKLLARILTSFEGIYNKFCVQGWNRDLEAFYYKNWLHTDQIISLEAESGARARIKGITRDWGLLLAEELGYEDRPTGKIWALQSDSNSFDFFKGLVKRKI